MMVSIRKLDKTEDEGYIAAISRLHVKAFPDFFLTQLGLPFLKMLYKGYLEDKNSGIIVDPLCFLFLFSSYTTSIVLQTVIRRIQKK